MGRHPAHAPQSGRPSLSDPPRRALLDRVAALVPAAAGTAGVRVAVDGVDGAGKTVFAGELAAALTGRGRPVVHAGVDDYHHPRGVRYRQGRSSPVGYWQDSFDYPRLVAELLAPFGPGGDRAFRRAVYDVRCEAPVDAPREVAPEGAVLVVDGIFLHRDSLAGFWDFSVFLDVAFDVSFARMALRDGCPPDPAHPRNRRYVEGQRLYLAACDPRRRASVVVDNTDPAAPRLVAPVGPGPRG